MPEKEDTMTTTTTATIEALTASVHVLRMGDRQITLGVYRQLDHVPIADLEPMGRVRDPQAKHHGTSLIRIIGRKRGSGDLARSHIQGPEVSFNGWAPIAEARGLFAEVSALPLIVLASR